MTIDGLEHIEYLPVMDYKNQSIGADRVTSFDVNKATRSLTKAVAHGGLYIYAGGPPETEENGNDALGNACLDVEGAKTVDELKEVYYR